MVETSRIDAEGVTARVGNERALAGLPSHELLACPGNGTVIDERRRTDLGRCARTRDDYGQHVQAGCDIHLIGAHSRDSPLRGLAFGAAHVPGPMTRMTLGPVDV
ncbi:MAG: hypothetical protein V6Z86_07590 [Hyphomicrobiales bacterium]